MSTAHSSSDRGSSEIDVAFSLPPPQSGRASSSSGRAMHASRIGASTDQSATCSINASIVGSAHCTSSIRNTSGRVAAIASRRRRIAHSVSSGVSLLPLDTDDLPDLRGDRGRRAHRRPPARRCRARASSAVSAPVSPAASRTASTTGRNVMPSP